MTDRETPPKAAIWAAGCVIVRRTKKDKLRFLLIHRPAYDDWTLPKGKLDKGETFLAAALREVEEETGVVVRKPRFIGSVGYRTKAGNPKVVRWWLAEGDKTVFHPNSEVDEIAWVSFDRAKDMLSYRNDRCVLARARDLSVDPTSGLVQLVRHADAGKRSDSDNDWLRPLDANGEQQAKAIRDNLLAHPTTRVGSSNYTRCVQTVEPLAKRLGIPVELEASLVEGSHPHRIVGLISELAGESAVLCSHGDVIADLVGHLFAEGVPMDGPRAWGKGSIWTLATVGGRVVGGAYTPPLT